MNREQAEHILDAYVEMECNGGDNKARASLREVILDGMTQYRESSNWSTSYPRITVPSTTGPSTTVYLSDWDGTPKITCTGIDPSFKQTTGGAE